MHTQHNLGAPNHLKPNKPRTNPEAWRANGPTCTPRASYGKASLRGPGTSPAPPAQQPGLKSNGSSKQKVTKAGGGWDRDRGWGAYGGHALTCRQGTWLALLSRGPKGFGTRNA